jgi:hypothetical protein
MISYSTVQRALAERLHEHLSARDYSPRLSHLDIAEGERWRQTVAWWLSACRLAVVLLSEDAVASPWVRYELSVLANRDQTERSMRLVLVYVGVEREVVNSRHELEPLALGEIQAFDVPGADLDDEAVAELAMRIDDADQDLAGAEPPVEKLVARVGDEVRDVAPERLAAARSELDGVDDPWLREREDSTDDHDHRRRAFGRAYCATPLERTYRALQTLAQDRHITVEDIDELIDFNVMTTFDARLVDRLHRAAEGDVRRSMVTATTRADLADVSTQAVPIIHGALYPYRFVVNGPVMGFSEQDVAEGLADELRHAIRASQREEPDDFLAAVARRQHPVYALLTSSDGMDPGVLRLLEDRFPTVVFVVLSSSARPMAQVAERLGVDGMGTDVDDPTAWAEYVASERDLATERLDLRDDLRRVKQATSR